MKKFLAISSLLYLITLVIGCLVIHFDSGPKWFVTLFLFAPRFVVAVPLIVLLPLTILYRSRWSLCCIAQIALIAVPILGIQLPLNKDARRSGDVLRVMTCNLGGGRIRSQEIVQFVRDQDIQVLMLQECPTSLSEPLFEELGWHHRQQYNMAIGSALPLDEPKVIARQPKENYEVAAAIVCSMSLDHGDGEPTHIVCMHLPTFRPAFQRARRFDPAMGEAILEMGETYRGVAKQAYEYIESIDGPLITAGDFNVPVESRYYRDYWRGLRNAQSDAGCGLGYTKFTRFHGVRIDHVLVNDHWSVLDSYVGSDFGGDHRPVIVELQRR